MNSTDSVKKDGTTAITTIPVSERDGKRDVNSHFFSNSGSITTVCIVLEELITLIVF